MGFMDRFSPGQRQALTFGVPAVAGVVVVSRLFGRKPATAGAGAPGTPSTDAIGTGELAGFETAVTDTLSNLATQIAGLSLLPSAPVPPPPTVPDNSGPAAPPAPPMPAGQRVVNLQASPVPGVYLAPLDASTVVGVTPSGAFAYGGTPNQVNQLLGTAPSPSQWDFSMWNEQDAAYVRSRAEW